MDDITPDTHRPVHGLPDDHLSSALPPPAESQAVRPIINGRQVLRPVSRSNYGMSGIVNPSNRPMPRAMHNSRPIQRPNQDSSAYANPMPSRPSSMPSTDPPVQALTPNSQIEPIYAQPSPLASQPAAPYQPPVTPQPAAQPQPSRYIPSPYQPPMSNQTANRTIVPKTSTAFTRLKSKEYAKGKLRLGATVATVLIVLAGATQIFSWLSTHYFSPYNKLVASSYSSQSGLQFSLIHPAVMSYNSAITGELKSTPVAYSYNMTSQREALIDVNYSSIKPTLHSLRLTPAELLSQIKAGSGSYIDYLNKTSPGFYIDTYKNCNSSITTPSGSDLVCRVNGTNGTTTNVIGTNSAYLYSLNLYIPTSIWSVHQNIWQKVEKSFSIQNE